MRKILLLVILILALILMGWLSLNIQSSTNSSKIQIVAAENFWGNLIQQIGGNKVKVMSIITDPNIDPHEYEANSKDAIAIAKANMVVINGSGYDSWAEQLLSASNNKQRQVLNIGSMLNSPSGVNPHFWYNPADVNQVVIKMAQELTTIDPKDQAIFMNNLKILQSKLVIYQNQIKYIAKTFGGQKVAATEDVFSYLAQSANLNLISPQAFITATANGTDPSAVSVAEFEQQLSSGQVKLLVYNKQTVTPLTSAMKNMALAHKIPIVGITETLSPPTSNFEDWMNQEVTSIKDALN